MLRWWKSAVNLSTKLRAGGLVIGSDSFFSSRSERLASLALRYALPAVYQWREFAVAGGLISYGTDTRDAYRLAGIYTARVLKGEKPADLPVQQATKVSHTPRTGCVRFVCGVAAASRNTRFQAARYGLTWVGLTPTDRASFAWRLHSFDHLVGAGDESPRDLEAEHLRGAEV
jgi:ABC transporter substrate binding protein